MTAFLGNDDPRPMFGDGCPDSFSVRVMLSILGHVEANYDRRGEREPFDPGPCTLCHGPIDPARYVSFIGPTGRDVFQTCWDCGKRVETAASGYHPSFHIA